MWYEFLVFVLFCLAVIDLTVGESGQLGEKARRVEQKLNGALREELNFYTLNSVSNRLVRLQVNIILDLLELIKHAEEVYYIHNAFNQSNLRSS